MYSLGLTAYGVAYAAIGKIVCLSEAVCALRMAA